MPPPSLDVDNRKTLTTDKMDILLKCRHVVSFFRCVWSFVVFDRTDPDHIYFLFSASPSS